MNLACHIYIENPGLITQQLCLFTVLSLYVNLLIKIKNKINSLQNDPKEGDVTPPRVALSLLKETLRLSGGTLGLQRPASMPHMPKLSSSISKYQTLALGDVMGH
jgi:hypothetical protein